MARYTNASGILNDRPQDMTSKVCSFSSQYQIFQLIRLF